MYSEVEGLVVKNTGSLYIVKCVDNTFRRCIAKGSMRIKGIRTTNPISAGDNVVVDLTSSSNDGIYFIKSIKPRRNYIIRRATNLSKQSHIIASNIDLSFLICTISNPETTTTFIDRFLSTSEAYSITTHLVFNKIDIYSDEDNEKLRDIIDIYQNIGYKCHKVSAQQSLGLDELKCEMQGKVTLFSGHSGVGKSTLINKLIPSCNLKTSDISISHSTGTHTTTFSQMIPLEPDSDSYVIDTPGIKSFGTLDFEPSKVSHYFPEIFSASEYCRFNNCTHIHEPGCNVKTMIDNGNIAKSRYISYIGIMLDKDQDKYRPEY